MVPGNLYLFWGYRTVHANEACDPDRIRGRCVSLWRSHADNGLRRFTSEAKIIRAQGGSRELENGHR